MKAALLSSLAALAVVPGLCGFSVHESENPHVLQLGMKRNRHDNPVSKDRRRFKRQSGQSVDVDLYGYSMGGELYSTNLTIGSPPQRTEVSVDTGSSDLWVVYTDNQICGAVNAMCDELGTYDPSESDTSQPLSDQFQIQYGDMSWARGYYAIDTLSIANAELPEVQFGIAIDSSIDKGILGIGYPTNVASREIYPNLPYMLSRNNITNSNAYSLWLNRLGEDEGNILFGGINTAHYTGSLQTLPVVPYNGAYVHLWLTLTGLAVESASDDVHKSYDNHPEFPVVVLLDSGATISYLPADIVAQIYSDLDVHFFAEEQFGIVPCDTYLTGREDYNVTFSFSGAEIRVPLSELVLQDALYYNGDYLHIDDEESCIFGIAPSVDFFPILGDSFLRSAYAVFDLENNEISLAQANFEPGADHILEIGDGEDSVPGATQVANPVTTATLVLSGSSLVLPDDFTNEPIFPSRTVTVDASTTAGTGPRPTDDDDDEGDDDDTSSGASGTAANPEESGFAVAARGSGNPLLYAGVAGVGILLGL
ncbi:aspartic peptidase domain-containing protein [Aspergillus pseudodeflectus]|uniref:Aspartic peptidase domain-containing protein n=1 Tax=Aspergillus pseudodeflectus TaxID=176178 RepID=A0ABR4LBS6_9EURO